MKDVAVVSFENAVGVGYNPQLVVVIDEGILRWFADE
jgi:hypothetical protein